MCSLVMSPCSCDVITILLMGSRLTGLTCSKAPGFWMVEHQLVFPMDLCKHLFTEFTILSQKPDLLKGALAIQRCQVSQESVLAHTP